MHKHLSAPSTILVATFLAVSCSKPELPTGGLPGLEPAIYPGEPGRESVDRSTEIATKLDRIVAKWQDHERAVLKGGVGSRLHSLNQRAAQRLATSNDPNGQIGMARSRLNRLLGALKQRGVRKDERLIITDGNLDDALEWLCPLDPFC